MVERGCGEEGLVSDGVGDGGERMWTGRED